MRFISAENALSRASSIETRSAPSIRAKATSWSPLSTTATESATRSSRATASTASIMRRAAASVIPAAWDAVGPRARVDVVEVAIGPAHSDASSQAQGDQA